jgi:hypothetical protein
MIDNYFELIERTILDFKAIINSYTIYKKAYSEKQGYIKGEINFIIDDLLFLPLRFSSRFHPVLWKSCHY